MTSLRAKGNAVVPGVSWSDSVAQKDEANHLLTLFNGTVRLPDDYYVKNKVAILPLRSGWGIR